MSKTRSLVWTAVGALAAVGVLLVPGAKGAHEVVIRDGRFQPQQAYLGEGDTMVFIHDDGDAVHTVTADDGSFDSSPDCTNRGQEDDCLVAGETWEHKFTKVGEYGYHSRTNPEMTGVIVVVEKGTGPSSSTSMAR